MTVVRAAFLGLLFASVGCSHHDERTDAPVSGSASAKATPTVSLAPSASPAERCAGAKKALDDFIATFPASCEKDEDCGGYFLHDDDICLGPNMLHVPGCPLDKKPLLFGYQSEVRSRCPPRPVCEPATYKAACRARRCVDATKS